MPTPASGTTIQRPDLGAKTQEFLDGLDGFISTDIFPIFPVPEKTAEIPNLPAEAMLSLPETRRAPKSAYGRSDWQFDTQNYNCEEHGWEDPVDDVQAALYARYFDAEFVSARRAAGIVKRNQEKRLADFLFNLTTFAGKTAAVTTEWSTAATAKPASDVKTARMAVYDATGVMPNTVVMSRVVRENLNLVTDIIDRIKYTNGAVDMLNLADKLIAQALGVDQVLVGNSKYNSADEGQAFAAANIWDDEYCLVCQVDNSPDLEDPSIGRTFMWTEDADEDVVIESYREEQTRANVVRARQHTDEFALNLATGYLLSNITI